MMAALGSCKLLVRGVVIAIFFTTLAFAGKPESEIKCPHGQVKDDQPEPQCCAPTWINENEDGKICVKPPSKTSVAVAITLLVSFTFLISLQCFMNHHDSDMREYAYTGISMTVSIFSAVLYFQSLNGLVENVVSAPLQIATGWGKTTAFVVNLTHLLLWYAGTQVTIAQVSCALKSNTWRSKALSASNEIGQQDVKLNVEINGICYGLLLAHVTGFASVKFWTEFQQIPPLNQSPVLTLAILPASVLVNLCLERLTAVCRQSYIAHRGWKDWFEEAWDEKCQHAEDDIMGLTLSVIIVNSLRFFINDLHGHRCLPNSEQKEEGPECEFEHLASGALWLLGVGLLLVPILMLTKLLFIRLAAEDQQEEVRKRSRSRQALGYGGGGGGRHHLPFLTHLTERLQDVILQTESMAYSWCIFHGTRQLLKWMDPNFLGKEENATSGAVVMSLSCTYIAWSLIRLLDVISDRADDNPEVTDAIKTVIRGTSIFVGFSWEQTFDEAIDQLAFRTRRYGLLAPAMTKLLVGGVCIGIVFVSWKWFILPYVFNKGWRYDQIFSKHDLERVCHQLSVHDEEFNIFHLHDVAQRLARRSTQHFKRFNMDFTLEKQLPRDDSDLTDCMDAPRLSRVDTDPTDYRRLPSSEIEAVRRENDELRNHRTSLEQALEERKAAETRASSEVEALRLEIEELRRQRRFLEEQLLEERDAAEECRNADATYYHQLSRSEMLLQIEELRRHRSSLEELLEERKAADERRSADAMDHQTFSSSEVEAMHLENEELRRHKRSLEEQLLEARKAAEECRNADATEYQKIPCSKFEAMHLEIEELRRHRRSLEEQFAEERMATEECKQKLAEERQARLDTKRYCESCGQALGKLEYLKEADSRECLIEFLERHLEEERKAQACCSRVGEEIFINRTPIRSSESEAPSTRRSSDRATLLLVEEDAMGQFELPESASPSPREHLEFTKSDAAEARQSSPPSLLAHGKMSSPLEFVAAGLAEARQSASPSPAESLEFANNGSAEAGQSASPSLSKQSGFTNAGPAEVRQSASLTPWNHLEFTKTCPAEARQSASVAPRKHLQFTKDCLTEVRRSASLSPREYLEFTKIRLTEARQLASPRPRANLEFSSIEPAEARAAQGDFKKQYEVDELQVGSEQVASTSLSLTEESKELTSPSLPLPGEVKASECHKMETRIEQFASPSLSLLEEDKAPDCRQTQAGIEQLASPSLSPFNEESKAPDCRKMETRIEQLVSLSPSLLEQGKAQDCRKIDKRTQQFASVSLSLLEEGKILDCRKTEEGKQQLASPAAPLLHEPTVPDFSKTKARIERVASPSRYKPEKIAKIHQGLEKIMTALQGLDE